MLKSDHDLALAGVIALVLAIMGAGSGTCRAAELDIRSWLDEPNVKLVAVEFYSPHCKPCIDAVPRWEALRKKYDGRGLRLLVVNHDPQSPGCPTLPWRPDRNICDIGGEIGRSWACGLRRRRVRLRRR